MKSNPTQIIKWLRTRQQGSSLPNREKAADLIEELQAAVIASQARIAELEARAVPINDRQLADAVNELRDIAIKFHAAGQLRERIAGVVRELVRGE